MRKLQNTSNYQTCCNQDYHQDLSRSVYLNGCFHVVSSEGTIVRADVGFVEKFAEVVVGTTKAAVEDGGEGGFWIAAVGRGVVAAVFCDKSEKPPPDLPRLGEGRLRQESSPQLGG